VVPDGRAPRLVAQTTDDPLHMRLAGAWRNDADDILREQDQSDAVASVAEQFARDGRELHRQVALEALRGPPVHRRAHVDHQPDVQTTLVVCFAYERPVRASRQLPVDAADIVTWLILTHLRKLDAGSEHA
jgi:hypothetical protein